MTDRYLQLIGTDKYNYCHGSVLIVDGSERILINCGENTQRLGTAWRLKIAKVTDIIIQSLDPFHTAGLPGFLLTVDSINKADRVSMLSSNNWICNKSHNYHFYRSLYAAPADGSYRGTGPAYEDMVSSTESEYLDWLSTAPKLQHIRLIGPVGLFASIKRYMTLTARLQFTCLEIIEMHSLTYTLPISVGSRREISITAHRCVETVAEKRPRLNTIPYIEVIGPQILGKLDVSRALTLGVPKGPLLGRLKAGNDVVLDCGTVIIASEVTQPALPGTRIIIHNTDCLQNPYCITDNNTIYLTIGDTKLEREGRYIHASAGSCESQISPYVNQNALNSVLARFVPEMFITTSQALSHNRELLKKIIIGKGQDFEVEEGPDLLNLTEERKKRLVNFLVKPIKHHDSGESDNPSDSVTTDPYPIDQPKHGNSSSSQSLILLGTGAAIPSKYRNVSSSLLSSHDGNVLFDAGEGTLTQLRQACSTQSEFEKTMRDIRILYVSHKHGDHINGLPTFLACRLKYDTPFTIIAPENLRSWIRSAGASPESIISCQDFLDTNRNCGDFNISTCYVDHIYCQGGIGESFGVRLTDSAGFSVSFSGDCAPCPAFTELISGSDILLNEATFDDTLLEEAESRKHCTISQAVDLGSTSGMTVLTHFSQRYPIVPPLPENKNIIYGMDFLRIPIQKEAVDFSVTASRRYTRIIKALDLELKSED